MVEINNGKSARPALSSGEERGLISQQRLVIEPSCQAGEYRSLYRVPTVILSRGIIGGLLTRKARGKENYSVGSFTGEIQSFLDGCFKSVIRKSLLKELLREDFAPFGVKNVLKFKLLLNTNFLLHEVLLDHQEKGVVN